ncbi:MAG: TonB-dependent receptor, partial [Saprospiraceae bacterium]
GLYIRGGGPDQNLVLLDEAIVYNTGHLLGFFSIFNSDAIKNTTLIKGSMPAEYGGRISSVIDVQMKDGNDQNFSVDGGIGIISSRLTVQGPISKNKSSFIVSGRRTYALDLAQPFISKTNFAGTNYYFYDLNTKINYRLSDKDRIYLSGYFGRDVFSFNNSDRGFNVNLPYGNATGTLRWNHVIAKNIFSNISLISNNYNFKLSATQEDFSVTVKSGVRDYSFKSDLDYYPNTSHHIKVGLRYTYHHLTPNLVNASNGEVNFATKLEPKNGHENEIYILDNWKIRRNIGINYGLRMSNFIQVGPYKGVTQSYGKGEIVKTYFVPEPRIVFNYGLNDNSSLKGGVTVASQYIHLVSNSGSTLPTDIWVPSSQLVKPQIGIQYSIGYYRNFLNDEVETSMEVYYKDLHHQLDYKESYIEDFSAEVENEFVTGKGRAYGLELFIAKKKGTLTGWLGYTLSRTERWFDKIENGRVFRAVYDRPHDFTAVANYQLSKKWNVSSSFIYSTGRAFTPIKSLFIIDARPNVEYGPRNSQRLEDYHRMDIAFVYDNKDTKASNFHSSWAFSIYNLYNRKNPFFTYTDFDSNIYSGNAQAKSVKVSIFTIIPSVTWNFSWSNKKNNDTKNEK